VKISNAASWQQKKESIKLVVCSCLRVFIAWIHGKWRIVESRMLDIFLMISAWRVGFPYSTLLRHANSEQKWTSNCINEHLFCLRNCTEQIYGQKDSRKIIALKAWKQWEKNYKFDITCSFYTKYRTIMWHYAQRTGKKGKISYHFLGRCCINMGRQSTFGACLIELEQLPFARKPLRFL